MTKRVTKKDLENEITHLKEGVLRGLEDMISDLKLEHTKEIAQHNAEKIQLKNQLDIAHALIGKLILATDVEVTMPKKGNTWGVYPMVLDTSKETKIK